MNNMVKLPERFMLFAAEISNVLLGQTEQKEYHNRMCKDIIRLCEEKQAAINKRNFFTAYKNSSGTERETARQTYVDISGMHDSFKTEREIPYDEI